MTRARLLLLLAWLLPLAWSLWADAHLGREFTSSRNLIRFLESRPLIVTWLFGWACCELVREAYPALRWWERAAIVLPAIVIGHCLWAGG